MIDEINNFSNIRIKETSGELATLTKYYKYEYSNCYCYETEYMKTFTIPKGKMFKNINIDFE